MKLIELTDKNDIMDTYSIYKHCMYLPSEEKFANKANAFLSDNSVKIFACLYENELKGVISVSFFEPQKIEIIGIAVDVALRNKGIGAYMINKLVENYDLSLVLAQTDKDAVGFYRKLGFIVTEFTEYFESTPTTRYKCIATFNKS